MRYLGLLKVVTQVTVVAEDDDGNLVELPTQPITVPAAEWGSYVSTGFQVNLANLRAQIDGSPDAGPPDPG